MTRNDSYKHIGYWRQYEDDESSTLPWPKEGHLPEETKELVVDYLINGTYHMGWRGYSCCRICGKINGSSDFTHDNFVYPEGYAHYIRDHNIMPDLDLLAHVLTLKK